VLSKEFTIFKPSTQKPDSDMPKTGKFNVYKGDFADTLAGLGRLAPA
jgi:hypothetical protein